MTLKQVPASCCKSNLTDCSSANPVAVSEIWTEDCFVVGLSFVQEHAVYLAGVALGISSLMVGGMASSIHQNPYLHKICVPYISRKNLFQLVGMVFSLALFKLSK